MKHLYQTVSRVSGIPDVIEADNYLAEDGHFVFVTDAGDVVASYPASEIASVSSSPKM